MFCFCICSCTCARRCLFGKGQECLVVLGKRVVPGQPLARAHTLQAVRIGAVVPVVTECGDGMAEFKVMGQMRLNRVGLVIPVRFTGWMRAVSVLTEAPTLYLAILPLRNLMKRVVREPPPHPGGKGTLRPVVNFVQLHALVLRRFALLGPLVRDVNVIIGRIRHIGKKVKY